MDYFFIMIYNLSIREADTSMDKSRPEGFRNEKLIVIPPRLRNQLIADPICNELYFTDIGLFPRASNHYVERPMGCREYVIQFCFNGEGYSEFESTSEKIYSNQYFILPPEKKHIYGSSKETEWRVGWIHFSGNSASKFINRINSNGFGKAHDFTFPSSWIKHFNDIVESLQMDLSYSNVAYNSCQLWPLLSALIFNKRINLTQNSPIDKAIDFMQNNIPSHLSLSEIAEVSGLSLSRFSVLFRETTGTSPKEYHIGLKIQKACSYLSLTDMPVKEIANELSFEDPYYFSRCFKKRMEVSPAHYRQQNIL